MIWDRIVRPSLFPPYQILYENRACENARARKSTQENARGEPENDNNVESSGCRLRFWSEGVLRDETGKSVGVGDPMIRCVARCIHCVMISPAARELQTRWGRSSRARGLSSAQVEILEVAWSVAASSPEKSGGRGESSGGPGSITVAP